MVLHIHDVIFEEQWSRLSFFVFQQGEIGVSESQKGSFGWGMEILNVTNQKMKCTSISATLAPRFVLFIASSFQVGSHHSPLLTPSFGVPVAFALRSTVRSRSFPYSYEFSISVKFHGTVFLPVQKLPQL
jgi:hypothetical protein